jgi:hypothetical protein
VTGSATDRSEFKLDVAHPTKVLRGADLRHRTVVRLDSPLRDIRRADVSTPDTTIGKDVKL